MTPEEHKLMVFMFSQHFNMMMSLIEALKSKGTLEADDIMAYDALLVEQGRNFQMFVAVAEQYKAHAIGLGLETGLPGSKTAQSPKPPESP